MQKIGIIGAMDEEIIALKELIDIEETKDIVGLTFYIGRIENKSIVLVRSGIGKVNAAICTQILIDYYHVEAVINTGVAGGLHANLNIGDIVISSDTAYHDMDATGFGYEKGIIPRMKESFFQADERLIAAAKDAGESLIDHHQYFVGRIVSGDQFISNKKMKEDIFQSVGGYCTEMEGTAIAHVCYVNKIPFVIIRSISDQADESAGMSYDEFIHIAASNSSRMIQEMIKNIKTASHR